ncbi:MAG: putative Ig domain-containing protein [Bacteroidota bacterium]|nr:putative Ig domain-containing protein [Bacteroidota bacterium]
MLGLASALYEPSAAQSLPVVPSIRFVSSPVLYGVVNQEYRYHARAVGRDTASAVRYSLVSAPAGMTIDSVSGLIRWTTSATVSGVRVAIRASLATQANQTVTQSFTVTILPASAAQPSVRFLTVPPANASVGRLYVYQAVAFYGIDPLLLPSPPRIVPSTNAALQYSLINAPEGATIDATLGTVRWIPITAGTVQFSIRAVATTIANASSTQSITVRVTEAQPVFITSPPVDAFLGQSYVYQAIAGLPTASVLPVTNATQPREIVVIPSVQRVPMTYTLHTAPQGMTIESTSGLVRWIPMSLPTTASVRVAIRASVVGGSTTQTVIQEYNLRVSRPVLVFRTQPPTQARVGVQYVYQPTVQFGALLSTPAGSLSASSFNNDLRYSLLDAPQGMSIDGTLGTIRWMPTVAGVFSVSLRVVLRSDSSQTTTQTYRISVAPAPLTLRFTSQPGTAIVNLGQTFTYTARAEASAPTTATIQYRLARAPEGASLDSLTGVLRWTPQRVGEFLFEIIAILPDGTARPVEARQAFTVSVRATVCAVIQGVVRATDGTVIANGTVRAVVVHATEASLVGIPLSYTASIRNGLYSLPVIAGEFFLSVSATDVPAVWFAGNALHTAATVSSIERATPLKVRCGDTLSCAMVVRRYPPARFFTVSGRVVQRGTNIPVQATIEAVGEADPERINGGIIRRTVRTDAQGNYRLTQLDDRYIYIFRALPDEQRPVTGANVRQFLPQYYDHTPNIAEARRIQLSGDLTNINFSLELRPTFNNSISGQVQSAAGVPISGRIVAYMTATTANTPQYASLDVRSETVETNGTFTLRNLTPGEYVLQVFPNNERDFVSGYYLAGATVATTRWREATRIAVTATSSERITIVLAARRSLSELAAGNIVGAVQAYDNDNSSSKYIAGATVYLLNEAGEVCTEALSDVDGRFTIRVPEHGTYVLYADKPHYTPATARIATMHSAGAEVVMSMRKQYSIPVAHSTHSTPTTRSLLSISPNPTHDVARIQLPSFSGMALLSVVNALGEEVWNGVVSGDTADVVLNIHHLPTGVYRIQLHAQCVHAYTTMVIAR